MLSDQDSTPILNSIPLLPVSYARPCGSPSPRTCCTGYTRSPWGLAVLSGRTPRRRRGRPRPQIGSRTGGTYPPTSSVASDRIALISTDGYERARQDSTDIVVNAPAVEGLRGICSNDHLQPPPPTWCGSVEGGRVGGSADDNCA